ncbi:hypothetical protein BABINDRAFT_163832 [Babjeviella inositovora NRRL Y-12698]|uniref:Uncharacterized protein n=1 Tax=Babjeviella inositovora NRRL Y-12698 TaxID=984486 RepID=A0A1E3QJ61_9ASCO|nr:uncharacterized protein BABINDRAFT_163832 [Babjeviella inositovora NRRL Y-12698]ODQ77102.1 hypothetical protein BABINDRAFT_163832 [Babjeviella inositovora NRRL Y-12698]
MNKDYWPFPVCAPPTRTKLLTFINTCKGYTSRNILTKLVHNMREMVHILPYVMVN